MTALFPVPTTSPAPTRRRRRIDDRIVVVRDPRPGTVVELGAGTQLAVTFRRGIGASRWHLAAVPARLLVLAECGHEFQFLVFGSEDEPSTLRFERRHPDREGLAEVCELLVVPTPEPYARAVSGAGVRTSRSAWRRTA